MATYIGMGANVPKENKEKKIIENLNEKITALEEEVATETKAKEEALAKATALEEEVAKLKKSSKTDDK